MKRVVLWLRGGLGNQLFQYSYGVDFARNINASLVIRDDLLPAAPDVFKGSGRWPEQLSQLELEGTLLRKRNQPTKGTHLVSKVHTILNHALDIRSFRVAGTRFIGGHRVSERPRPFEIEGVEKTTHLTGYFISPESPLRLRDELRERLLASTQNIEIKANVDMNAVASSFGVHVRLGDNLHFDPKLIEHLTEFYGRAFEKITGLESIPHLLIFSDNPDLAAEILQRSGCPSRLLSVPASLSPVETLRLMATTGGLLASASTFAWWGAFLNERQDRIFFRAPDKSFAANLPSQVYQPAWTFV